MITYLQLTDNSISLALNEQYFLEVLRAPKQRLGPGASTCLNLALEQTTSYLYSFEGSP